MRPGRHGLVTGAAVALCIAVAFLAWEWLKPNRLPADIASGNGRIEAVEVDIATKMPGRIKDILVHEGGFVRAGQILATMDTTVLQAQRREAEARLQQALIGVTSAESRVTQREAEKAAAVAVVAQREAELDGARRRLARSVELAPTSTIPAQRLDDDRARFEGAKAAVSAARSQVAATDAAIGAAQSQVIDAKAAVEATRATIERIQADLDDGVLRSPRDGRVQYRVAEPGEVLPAGGRVLNLIDLGDVYMTFFLPTLQAGQVALVSR